MGHTLANSPIRALGNPLLAVKNHVLTEKGLDMHVFLVVNGNAAIFICVRDESLFILQGHGLAVQWLGVDIDFGENHHLGNDFCVHSFRGRLVARAALGLSPSWLEANWNFRFRSVASLLTKPDFSCGVSFGKQE